MTDEQPTPSARARSRDELADYLLEIGATLASYGCPSYRLEDVIREVADTEGYRAEPFALPTGLFLRVIPKDDDRHAAHEVHRMTRLLETSVDLERLTLVDQLFNDVADRKLSIEQARTKIRAIVAKAPVYSAPLVWAASTASSGAAAVFFRGELVDVLAASVVGAAIGGSRIVAKKPAQRLLQEFLGGIFAAACAYVATLVWPTSSAFVIVLAGAISLFPGMTFTTGLAEIAQKNLVSGGARVMEAGVTLLLLLFGIAVIAAVPQAHVAPFRETARTGLGLPWQVAALVVSSLTFGVLFQVPKRLLWAALASGATGYATTALATRWFSDKAQHVAAFCAAAAVCMLANALARSTNRPAQLYQLPGMMLLVPGSFGFLSLGGLLEGAWEKGIERGFMMGLVGAALVIGVLVANVLVPARKLL
jgi:uncharacterized membrane protein YjjP (DUF1212 family)